MDMIPFVDALLKEYLLFRGFTSTFLAYSKEVHEVRRQALGRNLRGHAYDNVIA
jgi:hypothetical protein